MVLSASTVILEYVCPALGAVAANVMYSAPYRDVRKATAEGRLGDLNPTPWAVMLGNSVGWITYSIIINNLFVFFANAPGFILSIWLNLQAIKLQYGDFRSTEVRRSIVSALQDYESRRSLRIPTGENQDEPEKDEPEKDSSIGMGGTLADHLKLVWEVTAQHTKAPVAHERIVLFMSIVWLIFISLIVFARSFSGNTRELIIGLAANVNLLFFYGAPLSTIFTVLKTRSSATIHIPTMITNTLNGIFWAAFGIAVLDYFIAVPNGLGALLGGAQMVLCVLFPRKAKTAVMDEEHATSVQQAESQTTEEEEEKGLVLPDSPYESQPGQS